MAVKIAIASGKGGTGKTTVSLNLFHYFRQVLDTSVQLIDCDVEEPNDKLFLNDHQAQKIQTVNQLIPQIDTNNCTFCRQCVEYCEFNAIVVIPPAQFAEVNPALCHSCGACLHACNTPNAIVEQAHPIGQIQNYTENGELNFIEGRLNIGSAMQTMLIKEVIKSPTVNADIQLLDSPPGTSCPVVATVNNVDYCILVTEPSPFGLHDLKLMVDLLHELNVPFGVIINKSDNHYPEMDAYFEEQNIEVLGRIPFSTEYAKRYAQGRIFENIPKDVEEAYKEIISKLQTKVCYYA
ncbi:ATP-binding protein [Carboxylicivirga sp. A043]|uniref:ATP-binding protein n=1 Tax=Carboxylicivirga litoralis TaxID=2816963 RepID=UPI0021CB71FE|nr:ATP-binding protein [Carboxylicivirga sp. A043]MCU4156805.1 ATP-binding protein [Carboxylicivirga sp. A043]